MFYLVPACLCRLKVLTKIFKVNALGTTRVSNHLFASCILSTVCSLFMVNLLLTEGICSVLQISLLYASCCCMLLTLCVSFSNHLWYISLCCLGYWRQVVGLQIMYIQIPALWVYNYSQVQLVSTSPDRQSSSTLLVPLIYSMINW